MRSRGNKIKMDTDNVFEKYLFYIKEAGQIVGVNSDAFDLAGEAFSLFKELFNDNYGSIREHENLISIHSGGWSDNESLIMDFKETGWWVKNYKISRVGGHYYFDTDIHADNKWSISISPYEKWIIYTSSAERQ